MYKHMLPHSCHRPLGPPPSHHCTQKCHKADTSGDPPWPQACELWDDAPTSVSMCLVGAEAGGPGGQQSQCPGTAIASLSGCTPCPVAETEALLSGGEDGNMEALK